MGVGRVTTYPPGRAEDAVGDLEEAHRKRVQRRGRALGTILTALDAPDMALTLMRQRVRRRRAGHHTTPPNKESLEPGRAPWVSWIDIKLGVRMLVKYPGLSIIGGLGMAVAIPAGSGSRSSWLV